MQARGSTPKYSEQLPIQVRRPSRNDMVLANQYPSPFDKIPFEVLSHIFIRSIPTTYNHPSTTEWRSFLSTIFPLNIAAVCRAWRQEAMRNEDLWNTFYFEMQSPSTAFLDAFDRLLSKLLSRSASSRSAAQQKLTVGIRFLGEFDHFKAGDVVRPLLRHQSRWECVEIYFGGLIGVADGLSLSMSELVHLKSLKLHGMLWEVNRRVVAHEEAGNTAAVTVQKVPLSELVSLQLLGVQLSTGMALINAARNLQELLISVDMEPLWRPYRAHFARIESLKKLTIVNKFEHRNMFSMFGCPNLEELSLVGVFSKTFRDLEPFIRVVKSTLRSLNLKVAVNCHCLTSYDDWGNLFLILKDLPNLRSLSVTAGTYLLEGSALSQLSTYSLRDLPDCCTRLEELHLEGIMDEKDAFRDLVKTHWEDGDRTIRKMTFRNCMTMDRCSQPKDRVSSIEGGRKCKEEGLELDVAYDPSVSYEKYITPSKVRRFRH